MVVSFYDISDSFTNYRTLFADKAENEMEIFVQPCTKIKEKFSIKESYFDYICKKTMKYLKDLESKHKSYLEKTQGCIYSYYNLPEDMLKEDVNDNKKLSIYKDFLSEYASTANSDIWKYYEKNISDDILLKIKDLFDLYGNFDKFRNENICDCGNKCVNIYNRLIVECYKRINGEFCHEMEKFKEKYNDYRIKNEVCDSVQKSLPSAKSFFIIFFIIIPLVILSVISFIIFIIYKFTPFISHTKPSKIRNKKLKHIIYQESNELQNYSKNSNTDFENTTYNIKYYNTQK